MTDDTNQMIHEIWRTARFRRLDYGGDGSTTLLTKIRPSLLGMATSMKAFSMHSPLRNLSEGRAQIQEDKHRHH